MKSKEALPRSLELWLAHLLGYGTWIGCALIAAGLAIPPTDPMKSRLVLAGIGFFIALPVSTLSCGHHGIVLAYGILAPSTKRVAGAAFLLIPVSSAARRANAHLAVGDAPDSWTSSFRALITVCRRPALT
jgi:hypothetical protein